jgi:hypothetical protein
VVAVVVTVVRLQILFGAVFLIGVRPDKDHWRILQTSLKEHKYALCISHSVQELNFTQHFSLSLALCVFVCRERRGRYPGSRLNGLQPKLDFTLSLALPRVRNSNKKKVGISTAGKYLGDVPHDEVQRP